MQFHKRLLYLLSFTRLPRRLCGNVCSPKRHTSTFVTLYNSCENIAQTTSCICQSVSRNRRSVGNPFLTRSQRPTCYSPCTTVAGHPEVHTHNTDSTMTQHRDGVAMYVTYFAEGILRIGGSHCAMCNFSIVPHACVSLSHRSASSAAAAPVPADVTACR